MQYEDFDTKVKIIKQYEYKKLVTVQKSNVNVKKEPFIIYVSGLITATILTSLSALLESVESAPSSLEIPETYIINGSFFTLTLDFWQMTRLPL